MHSTPAVSYLAPTAPASSSPSVTEADFHDWLQELLPGVRAALARQGFEKVSRLSAFQDFLQERPGH